MCLNIKLTLDIKITTIRHKSNHLNRNKHKDGTKLDKAYYNNKPYTTTV